MKSCEKHLRGNSLIEAIVIMAIIAMGSVGTYGIISSGQQLSNATVHRIQAINLSREAIEGVINIRNTNWLRISSNYAGCWKVDNYNVACTDNTHAYDIADGNHILVRVGDLWHLEPVTTGTGVYLDTDGLSTQTGGALPTQICTNSIKTNCTLPFHRVINTKAIDNDTLDVSVITDWNEQGKPKSKVEFKTTLKNWKRKIE